MIRFLPLVLTITSFLSVAGKPNCGGEGQRACCYMLDCYSTGFGFWNTKCMPAGCAKGLKEVSLCGDELGTDKCGDISCSIGVCHKPPTALDFNRLREQHYIDYDAPLHEATFIGTHNSYNNEEDGYPFPNNDVNMVKQLEMGLRVLNLDLHELYKTDVPILCHDGFASGYSCSPTDTKLESSLHQIEEWIESNPTEVLLLVLEDLMDNVGTRQVAAYYIGQILGAKVYRPFDESLDGNNCHSLPLDEKITKRKLLDQGKQIILVTSSPDSNGENCNSGTWRELVWHVKVDVYTAGEGLRHNTGLMPEKWTFIPEDRLLGHTLTYPKTDFKKLLSRKETQTVVEKGANVIGLDFPRDVNRYEALIWSWDRGQPSTSCGSNCCAVQNSNGKWRAVSCSSGYKFACQNKETGLWSITSASGKFDAGQQTCSSEGKGTFSVPVNGNYNYQLNKINSGTVWVAYKEVDGFWKSKSNSAPTCSISGPIEAEHECTGTTIVPLDGSSSSDADGDTLTYQWSVDSACESISSFSSTTSSSTSISLDKTCMQLCTVRLVVSDGKESSSCSKSIRVTDTAKPSISSASDKTVESDGKGNLNVVVNWLRQNGGATAVDSCTSVTWTNDFGGLPDGCGSTGSSKVTFTATDECGLSSTTSATFAIIDTTPPTIKTAASDLTVISDGLGNAEDLEFWLSTQGGAVASELGENVDNTERAKLLNIGWLKGYGGGVVTWSNNFNGLSNGCDGTRSSTVTFTATDECALTSTTSATFTIVDPTASPPVSPIIITPSSDLTVESSGLVDALALSDWLDSQGGAVAASDTGGALQWSNNFSGLSNGCGRTGSSTVIFTVTDECGLESTTSATFTVVDTTPPAIVTPASNLTVFDDGSGNTVALNAWLSSQGGAVAFEPPNGEFDPSWLFGTPKSGAVIWSNNFSGLSDNGSTTVTFTATDECGLKSTTSAEFIVGKPFSFSWFSFSFP